MDTSSYTGLPNKLFQGLTSVKSTLTTGHILEKSEKTHIESNDKFHHHMARSVLGIQAPLKLQTEMQIANKIGRLPCLPSSRLMLDVLRGTNEDISFDDILNNPREFGEIQVDPHLAMDKSDRLF
jgi:proteasome maturation protein